MYNPGFAFLIAVLKTDGAAIKEALANNRPNNTEPPMLNPMYVDTTTPIMPLKVGTATEKIIKNLPAFFTSSNF